MNEVATDDCEGCDEARPVQQLEEIRLPSGQTVRCCPDCRYHAQQLLENTPGVCEGCGEELPASHLEPTPLTDGRKLDLCSDCVAEASTMFQADRASAARSAGDGASGATGAGVAAGGSNAVGSDAGRSDASSTTDGVGEGGDDVHDGVGTADGPNTDDGSDREVAGRTGKPATTDNVCDQCGEFFSIELYKVETVDGRTEEFCPDCKDEGVEEGIVRDVELRRAQAYEVLELDGGADQEEIRQAYLRRVKEVHPDRTDGNRSEFMLVKEAYDRLAEK